METLDLQQKAEELLEQLHQMKGFSEKYSKNQETAGYSVTQAADVIKSSQQTLERTSLLIERVSAFYQKQEKELEVLQQNVSSTIKQHATDLDSATSGVLRDLHTTFLGRQEDHIRVMQEHSKLIVNDIHALQSTVKEELKSLQTNLNEVVDYKFSTVGTQLMGMINQLEKSVNSSFERLSDTQQKDYEQTWQTIASLNKRSNTFFAFQIILTLSLFGFIYWVTRK